MRRGGFVRCTLVGKLLHTERAYLCVSIASRYCDGDMRYVNIRATTTACAITITYGENETVCELYKAIGSREEIRLSRIVSSNNTECSLLTTWTTVLEVKKSFNDFSVFPGGRGGTSYLYHLLREDNCGSHVERVRWGAVSENQNEGRGRDYTALIPLRTYISDTQYTSHIKVTSARVRDLQARDDARLMEM